MDVEKEKKRLQSFLVSSAVIMVFFVYVGLQVGNALLLARADADPGSAADFNAIMDYFGKNALSPAHCFPTDLGIASAITLIGLVLNLYRYMDFLRERNTMYGREHGSASFNIDYKGLIHDYIMSPVILGRELKKKYRTKKASGGRKQCKKNRFSQKELDVCKRYSQVYSKNVYLSLDTRLTQLNLNAIIFGGSGAGKSRFFVKPNLLQMNSSYVVTDPSGELRAAVGGILEANGYIVKCLNLEDMSQSCRYNPFAYVYEDSDIPVMVKALTDNIEGPKKGGSGDNKFWDETSQTLLIAVCGYLFEVCRDENEFLYDLERDSSGNPILDENGKKIPKHNADGSPVYVTRDAVGRDGNYVLDENGNHIQEKVPNPHWKGCQNFTNVLRLLNMADVSDDREDPKDDLDLLFDDLKLANPESYAVSQYEVIKQAGTGKTAQNIIISTTAIFARFFRLDKIANLTYKDDLHLEEMGRRKYALFICTPQGDTTYNFLASLLYTQLFNVLYKEGEENARRRHSTDVSLDIHVSCYIDEAANVGVIPQFPVKMATMRKYNMSCCPIYQNQSQVKALFKDDWESIVGNCDTMLFLGGIDASTVKTVSERLGKGTINTHNDSTSFGKNKSNSVSINTSGRELMTTTEIEQMANDHCIVFIRSMKPFCDYKYPLEDHPSYKKSGDYDEQYTFRIPEEWNLKYDPALMRRVAVKKTTDPDYIKPDRVPGVTDAEVAMVRKEISKAMGQQSQFVPSPQDLRQFDVNGKSGDFGLDSDIDEKIEQYQEPNNPEDVFFANLAKTGAEKSFFAMEAKEQSDKSEGYGSQFGDITAFFRESGITFQQTGNAGDSDENENSTVEEEKAEQGKNSRYQSADNDSDKSGSQNEPDEVWDYEDYEDEPTFDGEDYMDDPDSSFYDETGPLAG